MRIINRGRGNGKTLMLIHTSYVTGIPIVVSTEAAKEDVLRTANKINCDIKVYTLYEWNECKIKHHYDKVLIDECEDIINRAVEYYLQCKVVAGTMTVPMEELNNVDKR